MSSPRKISHNHNKPLYPSHKPDDHWHHWAYYRCSSLILNRNHINQATRNYGPAHGQRPSVHLKPIPLKTPEDTLSLEAALTPAMCSNATDAFRQTPARHQVHNLLHMTRH